MQPSGSAASPGRTPLTWLWAALLTPAAALAQQAPLGTPPNEDALPRAEFVFEEYVTLEPAVVLGRTALGRRQYIPITGGKVAGPKFEGAVLPGGWDYQLVLDNGCSTITADYFLRALDGTVVHVLNDLLSCNTPGTPPPRRFTRARFEAPEGPHAWLTEANIVSSIEPEFSSEGLPAGAPPRLVAVRIRFYQIR
jgi:hypothetical protein